MTPAEKAWVTRRAKAETAKKSALAPAPAPVPAEILADVIPNLRAYDVIVVSTSAGKDSQCALEVTVRAARAAGVFARLHVFHSDLGVVEWKGTAELAVEQALALGVPRERIHVMRARRKDGKERDLLQHIEERGLFPGPGNARYCTSDHKRGVSFRLFTELVRQVRAARGLVRQVRAARGVNPNAPLQPGEAQVRLLDVQGIRAEESNERSKGVDGRGSAFGFREEASNSRRHVDTWYPVFTWKLDRIWQHIRETGMKHHPAYDLGMPRLSCVFCFYSAMNRKRLDAVLIAGEHNPELLQRYVKLEKKIGHKLTKDVSAAEIQRRLAKGERGNPATASVTAFACGA